VNKGISFALLAVGIVLIFWGVSALNSFNSSVVRFFTGSPTNQSMWLVGGGIVASVVGFYGISRSAK
jgi:hypothetical protein